MFLMQFLSIQIITKEKTKYISIYLPKSTIVILDAFATQLITALLMQYEHSAT